ncbi:Alpha/Beta hydrolase protein [Flammula alnicola]|nr:Alpha/Beta hydrolase protein [Flammula alnicola]
MIIGTLTSALPLLSTLSVRAVAFTNLAERQTGNLVGPTVTLDYGSFTGLRNDSSGITYFRGIRFADPPIGDLRWKATVSPPSEHLGHVNAAEFADACISTEQNQVVKGTSEDCLFAIIQAFTQIYVPNNTRVDSKLPVMIWFHGGGYQTEDTHDAPPDLILNSSAKPLIFASFEYRLGQFGFLGGSQIHDNGTLNAGLFDQRAALQWVQKYIHLLVTLWGQFAGAASIMFHPMANGSDSEGLFRAAMGDSPVLTSTPIFNESYAEEIYRQVAEFAGCGNETSTGTLQCLRSASSDALTLAGSKLRAARPATHFILSPVIDGDFVKERPIEAFAAGRFARVPLLFGSNTDEGSHSSDALHDPAANTSMPNAKETTVFNFLRGQYPNITDAAFAQALELYPLENYNNSLTVMIAGFAAGGSNDVYQFRYDNPHLGSDHELELRAFFSPPAQANKQDLSLFESMREYWTSFVTDGRPTSQNDVSWDPASNTTGSPRVLLQPGNVTMEPLSDGLISRCAFWRSLHDEMQT